jgi:hypothetical protein
MQVFCFSSASGEPRLFRWATVERHDVAIWQLPIAASLGYTGQEENFQDNDETAKDEIYLWSHGIRIRMVLTQS